MPQDPVSEPLGHSLSRICRLTHARMHTLVGQIGLHRGQSLVLKALWGQNGRTHSELADLLFVRPATMTNMIKRMVKTGLVERRPDENDQRVSRVYLTEAGYEIRGQVRQVWMDFEAQVFQGFDQDELVVLRRSFEQIQSNLMQLDEEETP